MNPAQLHLLEWPVEEAALPVETEELIKVVGCERNAQARSIRGEQHSQILGALRHRDVTDSLDGLRHGQVAVEGGKIVEPVCEGYVLPVGPGLDPVEVPVPVVFTASAPPAVLVPFGAASAQL